MGGCRTACCCSGPPGTGKTLLARAVAGEAHAAFFSIAASEFIEAIVGVGAARVRDLFAKAKEAAPSIIFIDELDAIGRSRQGSAGITGANDEREQTLDQILTEMDGFEGNDAVVVLGATNRPEILDQALLRPGRFDRRVGVSPPDRDGRRKILEVHTRSIPLADDVDLGVLASTTPGMVGADLANLANEAALLATRRGHDKVTFADFTDSLEKILLGAPRGIILSAADRERTAYHESGHALVGMLTPDADPVRKVSIVPRGQALGVTLSTPDADRVSYSREELDAKIRVALGGRVAEEVVYGKITTGAESDIQQLTNIARQMVGRWGMSDKLGPVTLLPSDGQSPFLPGASETSPQTQWLVDQEVQALIEDCHAQVTQLLTEHRSQLDDLTHALLAAETLDAADAYAAAGVPMRRPAEPEPDSPRCPSPQSAAAVSHRVVVIGGGFGGLRAIQALRRAPRGDHAHRPAQLPPLPAAQLPGRHRRACPRARWPTRCGRSSSQSRTCGSCSPRWPGFDLDAREVHLSDARRHGHGRRDGAATTR